MNPIFGTYEFMPHGHCYLWKASLLWLHGVSDALIGLAYVTISLLLWGLIRRIRLPFSPIILSFGVFILACGFTHLMEIWTLWVPDYWFAGVIKAITAFASIATAVALLPSRPRVVKLAEDAALAEARRLELERKNAELTSLYNQLQNTSAQKLVQSEAQFQALVENLPLLAWTARPDGHIDFFNQRWYEYTGTTFEEMQGWGWEKVHHPDTLPKVLERWKHSLGSGEPFEMEFPLCGADGVFRWFLTRVRPLKNGQGQIVRWFGSNTNVQDQRHQAVELRHAIETRDSFLSVASHELKTPLTPLALRVDTLAREAAREPNSPFVQRVSAYTEVARRQLARLDSLVNELLDVSRIIAGRLTLQPEEVELVALVREVAARYESHAAQTGSSLTLRTPEALPCRVDRLRLEQIVTNLLDNAIKYGAGQPVEVELEERELDAVLRVRDQGIGIDVAMQEKIFERFERAVSERNYGGLGLGLYITKTVVDAMQGTIGVESVPGGGATFTVVFPRWPTAPVQIVAPTKQGRQVPI
jgi:PAS domain S-box-containing protein